MDKLLCIYYNTAAFYANALVNKHLIIGAWKANKLKTELKCE